MIACNKFILNKGSLLDDLIMDDDGILAYINIDPNWIV